MFTPGTLVGLSYEGSAHVSSAPIGHRSLIASFEQDLL